MNRIEMSDRLNALDMPVHYAIRMEQYPTDVRTAVELLFFADSLGRINGKDVADFGCGNGILGIGAALLGAKSVDFYDIDGSMVSLAQKNFTKLNLTGCKAYLEDFFDVEKRYDTVIANPPFGIQSHFNIKAFITKVEGISDSFFLVFKSNSQSKELAQKMGVKIKELGAIPIPKTTKFHKKKWVDIPVCLIYNDPPVETGA